MADQPTRETTKTGTVVPVAFDADENVTSIAFEAEGLSFRILQKGRGIDLMELLNEEVSITGVFGKDKEGALAVLVKSYKMAGAAGMEDEDLGLDLGPGE